MDEQNLFFKLLKHGFIRNSHLFPIWVGLKTVLLTAELRKVSSQVSQVLSLKVPSGPKLRQRLEPEPTVQVLLRKLPNTPSLGGWRAGAWKKQATCPSSMRSEININKRMNSIVKPEDLSIRQKPKKAIVTNMSSFHKLGVQCHLYNENPNAMPGLYYPWWGK